MALSSQQIIFTPTPDRLAKPTLSPLATQADYGAQVFWLYCMPCHGDKGQGLTDEFRRAYPQGDQNCWASGCHGSRPYKNGFTLPTFVPRLIGDGALNNFSNAAALYGFISAAMPFQAPGTLTSEQYYQVAAFLLRQNGLWGNTIQINASNAAQIPIALDASATAPNVQHSQFPKAGNMLWLIPAALGLIVLVIVLIFRFKAKI